MMRYVLPSFRIFQFSCWFLECDVFVLEYILFNWNEFLTFYCTHGLCLLVCNVYMCVYAYARVLRICICGIEIEVKWMYVHICINLGHEEAFSTWVNVGCGDVVRWKSAHHKCRWYGYEVQIDRLVTGRIVGLVLWGYVVSVYMCKYQYRVEWKCGWWSLTTIKFPLHDEVLYMASEGIVYMIFNW